MGGAAGGRGLPVDKRCEAQRKEARSAKKEGRGVLIKNGKAEVAYSRLIGRDTRYPFNRALKKKKIIIIHMHTVWVERGLLGRGGGLKLTTKRQDLLEGSFGVL